MLSSTTRYPLPNQRFRCEIEVERSRFITTLQEVCCPAEARDFVATLKAEFPDANHNCWAFLIGPPGSSDRIGLSDDGEPHGCAGKPILTCLQHSGLGDIAVVVTRYFGGIKLGKGGMVKAYTAAAQAALKQAPRTERITWNELRATCAYALVTPLERRLAAFEVEVLTTDYAEQVSFLLRLPAERKEGFRQMFEDLTAGQGTLTPPSEE
ncbi:MAG: YigZ family protein [Geopsychrobacter sp.]|nr:YigZ family protein [Geopsychrobacter sp.]